MAGADPTELREWKIFSLFTNEELEKVVSVNIFGTEGGPLPDHKSGLGALLLTNDDEVFHVGSHGHIAVLSSYSKGGQLKTEVDVLTGLGLKTIKVGWDYCVAISNDQNLYLWGGLTQKKIPDSAFVLYELYKCQKRCVHNYCGGYYSAYEFAGLIFLGRCNACSIFSPTVVEADSVKLVNFREASIRCTKCWKRCSPHKIMENEVNYCRSCDYLPQNVIYYVERETGLTTQPKRMGFSQSMKFVDVACGNEFFVALTNENHLILWGTIANTKYQGIIYNPSNAVVKVLSCGGNHVAVATAQGDLFTCGLGDKGQLGYNWTPSMGHVTLRKVPLHGKVLKVCGGYSSTVCLMADGSLMYFGSHMKVECPDVLEVNQLSTDCISTPARIMLTNITDIVNSPFTNIYFAKSGDLMFAWGREYDESTQPKLLLGKDNLLQAMADLPATFTFKAPCTQQSTLSPHVDSELYGQKFLSDLTLKLSDGDFPAHRLILHANSAYFRDTFGESDSDSVLDMTHYNPEAYRCLLKYFYHIPPTDLTAVDLFDLYMLANSYKETDIAQEVFNKLKANLNPETVRPLLLKAKEVGCSEFLEECNSFIKSPEFKHILAEKVSQSLDETLSILNVLDSKK